MATTRYWKIIRPEATTNLVTNPSFETNTTSWSAGGTNTIAQIATQSKFGAHSLQCTYVDHANLAQYLSLTLTDTAHTFSCWIRISAAYDGTQVRIRFNGFANMTGGGNVNADMTITNEWQFVETTATAVGADLSGSIIVDETGTPTAGVVGVEGVLVEAKSYSTTFCDGDQPGCVWTGTAHASTSKRDEFESSGGRVLDLGNDLEFIVATEDGSGMPPFNNHSSPLPLQPGNLYDGQTIGGRQVILNGHYPDPTVAESVSNFHSKKQTLLRALNARLGEINAKPAPVTFRYTGGAVDKEFMAVYDGGLEGGLPPGFTELNATIRLKQDDPLFYQIGESAASIDTNDAPTASRVMGRIDGVWSVLNAPAFSAFTDIYDILAVNLSEIYFVGTFTNADGIALADHIVVYDSVNDTWSAVGDPVTGATITAIWGIKEAPNGDIYIVGDFTNISGVANADYIAKFDGTSWTAVGNPNSGGATFSDVRDIAWDSAGDVYITGNFTNVEGVAAADYIAKYDISASAWVAVGAPNSGASFTRGYTLAVDRNDNVYMGGAFTNVAGVAAADNIAKWDGSNWTALGDGANGIVYTIALDDGGILYAGGGFTSPEANIAQWNGQAWTGVGAGLTLEIYDLSINTDGRLLATGQTGTLQEYNGSVWNGLDLDTQGGNIFANAYLGDDIYLADASWSSTINHAGSTTVSYAGTEQAYPYFRIKRSGGTSAQLRNIVNTTTGAVLYLTYDLQDGEELIIDLRPGQERMVSTFRGIVWNEILAGSDDGAFYLAPGNSGSQDNIITAYIHVAGGPTITANLIYRDAFLSQD